MYVSPLMTSPAVAKRARSALLFGIEPETTVTLTLSSFVPCPNELSVWLRSWSCADVRAGALSQSWLPVVLTTRLPSLPSKLLAPMSELAANANTSTAERATSVVANHNGLRRRRSSFRTAVMLSFPFVSGDHNHPRGVSARWVTAAVGLGAPPPSTTSPPTPIDRSGNRRTASYSLSPFRVRRWTSCAQTAFAPFPIPASAPALPKASTPEALQNTRKCTTKNGSGVTCDWRSK